MNYLLPLMRHFVPVVAFLLLSQVGWAQGGFGGSCGFSANSPATGMTTVAAPTTITNDITFWNRYSDGATALNGCTGCDQSYMNGSELTSMPYSYPDYGANVNTVTNPAPNPLPTFYSMTGNYASGIAFATTAGGPGVSGAANGDLPIEHLPATLPFGGGTMVEYFDVDFEFDPQNCTVEVLLDNTFWNNSSGDCQFVNYYDRFGELLGREDLRIGSVVSGGAVFSLSDHPVPFVLDDKNINAPTAGTKGYPTVGDFVFMQIDNGSACDAADYDPVNHIFGATRRSVVKAFRIRSISDVAGPIIKGTFDVADDYCNPINVTINNNPTDVVGDPRSGRNDTQNTITDNDMIAGRGTVAGYDVFTTPIVLGSPTYTTARDDQTRALLCRELDHSSNDNGGVLPGDLLPDPYKFNYVLDYGRTDQLGTTAPPMRGTGFIDGTNPANVMRGTRYPNTAYAGTTTVMQDAAMMGAARTSTNTFRVFTPDACGGAVSVAYTDATDFSDRGNIYGRNSDEITGTEDVTDGVLIPAAPTFGRGGDGRFRDCYDVLRKWSATDASGNMGMCEQKISVIDDYESSICRGGGTPQVSQIGSPFFLTAAPTSGTDSIVVFPRYFDKLTCASNVSNIYQNTPAFIPQGGSMAAPIPTLYSYTNPLGTPFPDVVAPNLAVAGATQGAAGASSTATHYNFPVFTYAEDKNTYTCAEAMTLDGFTPTPVDSCGLRPLVEIETLYDYGLDGDFGDIGPNVFISGSTPPPFYDKAAGIYYNNFAGGDQAQTTGSYVENDDRENGFTPAQCQFYKYDILKRWIAEDNCGFKSVAQRIYRVRDMEAPDASMASAIQVNGGAQTLMLVSNTNMSPIPGDTLNTKKFRVATPVTVPFSSCTPPVSIITNYDDNCADDIYLNTTYDIEVVGGSPVISGVPYAGSLMIPAGQILAGTSYLVTLKATDPCGNETEVEIIVNTDPSGMSGCTETTPVPLTLSSGGTAQLNSTQVMPTSSCIQTILLNGCSLPSCVYLEMMVDGNTVAGDVVQTTSSYDLNILNLSQIPTYVFNCQTGSFSTTVNMYAVAPCNSTHIDQPFNASTQTRTLIGTHTREVIVSSATSGGVSLTATPIDASGTAIADGQISLTLSSGFPAETFTVGYQPISAAGLPLGPPTTVSTTATAPSFTISGLLPGRYEVDVQGSMTCGGDRAIVTIGVSTPVIASFNCPNPSSQPANNSFPLPIIANSGFNNLGSLDLDIQLSVNGSAPGSPAAGTGYDVSGASMISTFNSSVSSSGGIFLFGSSSTPPATHMIQISAINTPGVNVTPGSAFINLMVALPSTAVVGDVVTISVSGTAGIYTDPTDPMRITDVPFAPITCTFSVSTALNTTLQVGGNITYQYYGHRLDGVPIDVVEGAMPASVKITGSPLGDYLESGITSGTPLTVTPSYPAYSYVSNRIEPYTIGVNDVSILQVIRNNVTTAVNPYQLIAGDIDGNGVINNLDILQLANAVFSTDPAVLDLWLFIDSDQTHSSFTPTPRASLQTSYSNAAYSTSDLAVDFIAVKVGDLFRELAPLPNTVASYSSRTISFKDRAMTKGDVETITFDINGLEAFRALQAELAFDPTAIVVEGVSVNNEFVEEGLGQGFIGEDNVKFLLSNAEELLVNGAIFSMEVRALRDLPSLTAVFSIGEGDFRTYVSDNDLRSSNLVLEVLTDDKTNELYDAVPNPFSNSTTLRFALEQEQQVELVVTDITGRVVYRTNVLANAGYNETKINATDLESSGVLIYTILSKDAKMSGKLILNK
ncbi:MAG: T9SS type A sorting domain-containing protein [Bacteroidota bacterium]